MNKNIIESLEENICFISDSFEELIPKDKYSYKEYRIAINDYKFKIAVTLNELAYSDVCNAKKYKSGNYYGEGRVALVTLIESIKEIVSYLEDTIDLNTSNSIKFIKDQ